MVESPDERESNPDKTKILSVKLNEGGVVRNETTDTLKIGATIYYKRKAGSFIYGRQNLFHGAFGIVPKQLNNYLSSADVPAFTFKSEINPKYFSRLVSHNCKSWEKLSNGSGSKRLKEDDFLGISICVPDLNTQNKIESRFEIIDFDLDKQEECLNCLIKLKNYLLSSLLRVSY